MIYAFHGISYGIPPICLTFSQRVKDLVNPGDVLVGMLSLISLFIIAVKLPSCNDLGEKQFHQQ
jgi:hypothetical protein